MLIKASRVYGLGFSLLAISAFAACGSDPDNSTGGTAGKGTGTAGSLGTAGTAVTTAGTGTGTAGTGTGTAGTGTGTAGTTGAGGTGGGSSTACAGTKPASALITEFADLAANPTTAGQLIFTLGVPGGSFSYEKPAIAVADTGMALNAKGMVSTYDGFGVYLNACTDASAYTGVSFSIKGTLGTKTSVNFRVQTNKNTKVDTVNKKGECTGTTYEECHDGGVDVMVGAEAKTVEVKWSELMGGVPSATVSGKDIVGFEWAFPWAVGDTMYAADVTIDNLKFTGGTTGGTGAGGSASGGSGGSGGSAAGSGGSGGAAGGSGGSGGTN